MRWLLAYLSKSWSRGSHDKRFSHRISQLSFDDKTTLVHVYPSSEILQIRKNSPKTLIFDQYVFGQ